jgi:hypothetical protein
MKKKLRSAGRGARAAERLLGCMARANGASLRAIGDGFIVHGGTFDGEIKVVASPTTHLEWRTRLEWLEKQAARFVLGAPLAYSAAMRSVAGQRASGLALRLSFGLSLSFGHPLRQRFSAYVFSSGRKPELRGAEGDSLENAKDVKLLLRAPVWVTKAWAKVVPLVEEACERYESRPDVQEELGRLAQRRRESLWYLHNLYNRREGFNDHIYGLPLGETSGSAAIAQEYQNCQLVVLRRYSVRIEVKALSLGVLSSLTEQ